MNQMSAHFIFDMGNPDACEEYGRQSALETKYTFLRYNVTWMPEQAYVGVCLPVGCSNDNLVSFSDKITNKLNSLLDYIDTGAISWLP